MDYKEKYYKERKKVKVLLYLLSVLSVLAIIVSCIYINKLYKLKAIINDRNDMIFEMDKKIESLRESNLSMVDQLKKMNEINEELSTNVTDVMNDNIALATEYDDLKSSYDKLKERKELYDKYSYAIMYNGERTELTYDQIKTAEELAKEKGIDPNLVFSVGMVESKFDPECTTTTSTAKGYFQFLKGTGEFTYNTLMGKSDYYNHDKMAKDPYTSIEMAVNYMSYLNRTRKNNYGIIKGYTGLSDPDWYIDRMNNFLSKVNKSFRDLA